MVLRIRLFMEVRENCGRNWVRMRAGLAGVRLRLLLPQSYLHTYKLVANCVLFGHKLQMNYVHSLHAQTYLVYELKETLKSDDSPYLVRL